MIVFTESVHNFYLRIWTPFHSRFLLLCTFRATFIVFHLYLLIKIVNKEIFACRITFSIELHSFCWSRERTPYSQRETSAACLTNRFCFCSRHPQQHGRHAKGFCEEVPVPQLWHGLRSREHVVETRAVRVRSIRSRVTNVLAVTIAAKERPMSTDTSVTDIRGLLCTPSPLTTPLVEYILWVNRVHSAKMEI